MVRIGAEDHHDHPAGNRRAFRQHGTFRLHRPVPFLDLEFESPLKELRIFAPFSTCLCVEVRYFQDALRFSASRAAHVPDWGVDLQSAIALFCRDAFRNLRERLLFRRLISER
jgi:hypothetical protein